MIFLSKRVVVSYYCEWIDLPSSGRNCMRYVRPDARCLQIWVDLADDDILFITCFRPFHTYTYLPGRLNYETIKILYI